MTDLTCVSRVDDLGPEFLLGGRRNREEDVAFQRPPGAEDVPARHAVEIAPRDLLDPRRFEITPRAGRADLLGVLLVEAGPQMQRQLVRIHEEPFAHGGIGTAAAAMASS